MGGNGPLVVMDDADLDAAVTATLTACFLNAGQSCTAGERILVHEAVKDDYVAALTAAIDKEIHIGDPFRDATTLGPVNNARHGRQDRTARRRRGRSRGATVVTGGRRAPEAGSELFYEATVLDGVTARWRSRGRRRSARSRRCMTISSLDEAIAAVNSTEYGLLSAIFTRDLRQGLRFAESVRSGWVNVNEGTNYWESHLPFGGRAGSSSGVGRVGGRFSMDRLTELKTVVVDLGG